MTATDEPDLIISAKVAFTDSFILGSSRAEGMAWLARVKDDLKREVESQLPDGYGPDDYYAEYRTWYDPGARLNVYTYEVQL